MTKTPTADTWSTPLGLTWMDIGGDAMSLFTFVLWVAQIIRSGRKYMNFG